MEELIDVLDENGIKTGEVLSRKEIHKRGLWHRIVLIAVINEDNRILIQQRSYKRTKNAGKWDLSAAKREIFEEIGLDINVENLEYIYTYKEEEKINEEYYDRQFYDFFILRKNNLKIQDIKIQEEVEQVKFVSINELNEMMENKEVVVRDKVYKKLMNNLWM